MEDRGKILNPFELIFDQLGRIESLLVEIKNLRSDIRLENHIVENVRNNSIELAVQVTGLKKKTIYNLVNKRMIPHSKKGKRLYFDEHELNAWIRTGKRKTIEELRREVCR